MNNHEIMEKVSRIKGECPNFYITGSSVSALENLGMQLAHMLEQRKLLAFKGLVKHFTIKMPYFDDMKSAVDFLSHLKNSYSIARDCYDFYCGIIVIEMSEEWIKNGYNSFFSLFLSYLQSKEQVCFIMLLPETKEIKQEEVFFAEFARCGIWMKIQADTPSVEHCVGIFCDTAQKHGFQVSDEAEKLLRKKLEQREEFEAENITVVRHLIKQILFNRMINEDRNKIIEAEDIVFISGTEKKATGKKIGFMANYR